MSVKTFWRALTGRAGTFAANRRANIALTFALALVPMAVAAGAGLDLSRALIVRARLSEALDAAGLAVGGTNGLSQSAMQAMAQQYFDANYHMDPSYGTPSTITVAQNGQSVTLATHVDVPTVLVRVADIISGNNFFDKMTVHSTSEVVWGQTKLWVSLVLDNTGSMSQTDSSGTSKMSALKSATHQLLGMLQNAATNPGDVKVAIVPFSKDVNVGTSNVSANWIDWTDWEAPPANGTPDPSIGPGSNCPYSSNNNGFRCTAGPTNGSTNKSQIPTSGTYKGYICPGVDDGSVNSGRMGRYYNGCYDSVSSNNTTTITCTQVDNNSPNCTSVTTSGAYTGSTQPTSSRSCSGSGWQRTCTTTTITKTGAPYSHTWLVNNHSTWTGCVMDRTQDYDVENTDGVSAKFPAENAQSCLNSTFSSLNYDWTSLSSQVDAMSANGATNQTIGLAWGWQAQSNNTPMNAGALPDNTSQVIILLSDGLNTQNRWNGDGSNQSTDVDNRMNAVCANAKAQGIIVYTVFVDLNGTQGNSDVLENCATDTSKYFDLTTTGAITTAFTQIGQQITNLRVAQ